MSLFPVKRALVGAWLALAGACLLVGAAVYTLVGTHGGARWALDQGAKRAPGTLSYGRVEGTLLGPLAIHDLSFEDERMRLRVARVALDWEPGRLWRGELAVRSLRADGVRLELRATAEAVPAPSPPDRLPAFDPPLALVIGDVSVRDIAVRAPGMPDTTGPLRVDSLRVAGVQWRDTLSIAEIALRAPLVDLIASGRIVPRGDYPLSVALDWVARPEGLPPHAGHGSLAGSVPDLAIEQRLVAPFRASLDARVRDLPRPPRYEARAEFESLEARDYGADLPVARASGEIEIAGDARGLAGTGSVRLAGRPARVSLSGRLDLAGREPVFHVTIDGSDLAWPLTGPSQVDVPTAAITAAGTASGYEVDARADVTGAAVPAGRWRVSGRGDGEGFVAHSLEGQTLGGRVAAEGAVRWAGTPTWRAALSANALDPGRLWPEWPGSVAFRATTEGRMETAGPRGRIDLDRIGGSLRDRALSGRAALAFAGAAVQIDTLEIILGGAALAAGGSLDEPTGIAFHVALPDAGTVWPGAAGAFEADGRVTGTPTAPRLALAAHAESLAVADAFIASARIGGDLDLAPGGPLELDVVARGILAGGAAIDSLHLVSSGDHAAHAVTVSGTGGADRFAAGLTGTLTGLPEAPTWQGEIGQLDLDSPIAGQWTLVAPSSLLAGGDGATLGELGWRSGASQITLERAAVSAGAWHVAARVESVALARVEPFLPAGVTVEGALNGRVEAHGRPGAAPVIDAAWRTTPGALVYPTAQGTRTLALGAGSGEVVTADSALISGFRLPLAASDSLVLRASLPGWTAAAEPGAQPIRGRIDVHLSDLNFVQAFAPELEDVGGRLHGALDLGGTLEHPTMVGNLALADGRALVPQFGLRLTDGALTLDGREDGALAYEGRVTSGEGTLRLVGEASLPADGPARGRLTLAGERIQAFAVGEQRLFVSPDLAVTVAPESLMVTGTVTVPEGHLIFEDLAREAAVPVSPDVVIAGESDSTGSSPALPLHADVQLVLEDGFTVDGYGMKGSPRGRLRLLEQPGAPTRASGELTLADGTYKVYGQKFDIERGRLIYSGGPLPDPGLDVRVSRRARDGVVAGFEIGGTLEQPSLEVFSEPPLSEQEALSYALVGRSLGQAGGGQADMLSRAATKLGLGGGTFLARSIANRFGIAQARIESKGQVKDASLILGTYLSPRLYVNYGVGLFEPVTTLRLRYTLSRLWTLEAETAEENSADLLYTIER